MSCEIAGEAKLCGRVGEQCFPTLVFRAVRCVPAAALAAISRFRFLLLRVWLTGFFARIAGTCVMCFGFRFVFVVYAWVFCLVLQSSHSCLYVHGSRYCSALRALCSVPRTCNLWGNPEKVGFMVWGCLGVHRYILIDFAIADEDFYFKHRESWTFMIFEPNEMFKPLF